MPVHGVDLGDRTQSPWLGRRVQERVRRGTRLPQLHPAKRLTADAQHTGEPGPADAASLPFPGDPDRPGLSLLRRFGRPLERPHIHTSPTGAAFAIICHRIACRTCRGGIET